MPPLSNIRDDLRAVPEALRVPILIIDFDTEVHMQGILFFTNSTCRYLSDTIEAFRLIHAHKTAATLETIQSLMAAHGVTPEQLSPDFSGAHEYAVTTFSQLYVKKWDRMAEEICYKADHLYVYTNEGEQVFELLERYVEEHKYALLVAVNRACEGVFSTGPAIGSQRQPNPELGM